MKNYLLGFVIGITSLIPGISAGTIIYLTSDCASTWEIIKDFKHNILNIIKILIGIILGVLIFSKIIEYLFIYFPYETIYLFIGFLLLNLKNSFVKTKNLNLPFLIFGTIIIYFLYMLSPSNELVYTTFPTLSLIFLFIFTLCGFLDGFLTITPGISGSMVMMILGPYYLYKSYLANFTFSKVIVIPLLCYFIGDILGFYFGAIFSSYMLKKNEKKFQSIILGMMLASIIILIPNYFSLSCLIALLLGIFITRKN